MEVVDPALIDGILYLYITKLQVMILSKIRRRDKSLAIELYMGYISSKLNKY